MLEHKINLKKLRISETSQVYVLMTIEWNLKSVTRRNVGYSHVENKEFIPNFGSNKSQGILEIIWDKWI